MADAPKFTPGPWDLFAHERSQEFYLDSGVVQVNFRRTSDAGAEQMAANARLWAAAPLLFEALQELLSASPSIDDGQLTGYDAEAYEAACRSAADALAAALGQEKAHG